MDPKDIKADISRARVDREAIETCRDAQEEAQERLWSGKEKYTGWVKLPLNYDQDLLDRILMAADRIQEQCERLIVIGIGGSYLGAKAVIEALAHTVPDYGYDADSLRPGGRGADSYPIGAFLPPKVLFAGCNLSAAYHARLLSEIREHETCLCVISKSGSMTETAAVYAILKEALEKKYGKEKAAEHIYAVTDAKNGALRKRAEEEGYVSFEVPEDIGGRYSVLTPVGLLPIAAAGIDIKELILGAESMAASTAWDFSAPDYACARYILGRGCDYKGKPIDCGKKDIEIFEYYEPQLAAFSEWLKQLFGESEGKEGKGLFPAALAMCTDLHSMGQFLQEGHGIFFETVLNVIKPPRDLAIPQDAGELLSGKSLHELNRAAMEAALASHAAAGVPAIKIDIPELTPFYMGQLIYFFEMSSAISAHLLGVEPFGQPGVERYKAEMQKILHG